MGGTIGGWVDDGRGMFGNCAVLKDAISKKKKYNIILPGIDNFQGVRVPKNYNTTTL